MEKTDKARLAVMWRHVVKTGKVESLDDILDILSHPGEQMWMVSKHSRPPGSLPANTNDVRI